MQDTTTCKPLKRRANNTRDVVGFDVETYQTDHEYTYINGKSIPMKRQDFYMGSVVSNDTVKVFYDKDDMCDYLLSPRNADKIIMATNLDFDFNMLFYDRMDGFRFIYRNRLIGVTRKEDDRKWSFYDSLSYIKASVRELGEKIVGIEKTPAPSFLGQKPRDNFEKMELEQYNINDSTITQRFGKIFLNFCNDMNMKLKFTISSTGNDFFRRNYQDRTFSQEPRSMLDKHFLGSFRGGHTQVYKRGRHDRKLYYFDYASHYPARMRDGIDGRGSFPDPSTHVLEPCPRVDHIDMYDGICHATVSAPYSYIMKIGIKYDSKLLFPYGTFSGWFTNAELRQVLKDGGIVQPHNMVYYHSSFVPFRDCVKDLYRIRKKYKTARHPYDHLVKTLMNGGLFGRWGMNYNNMEEIIPLQSGWFENGVFCIRTDDGDVQEIPDIDIHESNSLIHGFVSHKKEGEPDKLCYPIISETVTALGRLKLLNDISPYADNVVYCDTDSAIMTRDVFETGSGLGEWEKELTATGGIFIRPKMYELFTDNEPIIRTKGLRKHPDYDGSDADFFSELLFTGHARGQRWSKMKGSSRMNIKSGSILDIEKHVSFEDDKRDWLGTRFDATVNHDSKPLCLNI